MSAGESSLPTGMVAFLFSDIEGSTRRWEAYGDAMRDAVRRHDEILRSAIERHRGCVFKTVGDAFCASFWSIDEALEAGVEAQRRLAVEDFTGIDGLRVRMAIHGGETDERDGDYFGTPVNRTARLLSAGHGGQILLSGFAADGAAERLPAGVSLQNLGTLPLRDLKEPERVYQPVGAGLRSDFKPLRALETAPNNLPRQTTKLVGRDTDVGDLERLLRESSLVTIVGAGGMGKTRLALEAAAATLNDRRDGAWFVDLSPVTDPAIVAGAILAALGAPVTPGDAGEYLAGYLAPRELLLILDNCEHLIAEAARIAAVVLARCPHVTLLATSRVALDIGGEQIYRVGSLDREASAALFVDRAQAADPRFSAEKHRDAVDEICRRLDGIALAIELAAARVRTIAPERLAEHLELRMLAGGRDKRPRQQTMRALVDWSYDLLEPAERAFLRRCAVFSGGCSLEAAASVAADDDADDLDALELLASLVDKSLIVSEQALADRRYRLLEPIRQYAAQRLAESGETAAIRERHALAFAALARAGYEEWDAGPAPDWLARLGGELSNFRAALAWTIDEAHDLQLGAALAGDTTPIFLRLSLLAEGIEWCESVVRAKPDLPPEIEARLRYGLSMLYNNQGMGDESLASAVAAVSFYRGAGDRSGLARALSQVANQSARREDFAAARSAADAALENARDAGDQRLLADVLRRCALAFSADGTERVREAYAESVAIFRALGREDETARALTWWGQWETRAGEYRTAADLLLEAREHADRELAPGLLVEIVACYLMIGDRVAARPLTAEALALATKFQQPIETPFAILYSAALGAAYDPLEAARLIGYADARHRVAKWRRLEYDRVIADRLTQALAERLGEAALARLLAEGAALSEKEAVARATALSLAIP